MFEGLIFLLGLSEAEHDRGAGEVKCLTHIALKVTLVTPVQELEVAAENNEPWRGLVCLDHVAKLWHRVFEPGRRVLDNAFLQYFVEF